MCEELLINPLNVDRNPKRHQTQLEQDWSEFKKIIDRDVAVFHKQIEGKYHPNTYAFFGSHLDKKAYGEVKWTGDGGSWLRGNRHADVLDARPAESGEIKTTRTVTATLEGSGWQRAERQRYRISEPDEPGDGTVPHRSGVAPWGHMKGFLQVNVGHESAYEHDEGAENLRACRFTLRAIVKIAQLVKSTSMHYEE